MLLCHAGGSNERMAFFRILAGVAALLTVSAAAGGSSAAGPTPGPLAAKVLAVVDGDTIEVEAEIWPGLFQRTRVRLAGVDAPELKGRCEEERRKAREAKALIERLAGGRVTLLDVRPDKYGGRIVAKVLAADGTDLAAALIGAGLARSYAGGKREGWCEDR